MRNHLRINLLLDFWASTFRPVPEKHLWVIQDCTTISFIQKTMDYPNPPVTVEVQHYDNTHKPAPSSTVSKIRVLLFYTFNYLFVYNTVVIAAIFVYSVFGELYARLEFGTWTGVFFLSVERTMLAFLFKDGTWEVLYQTLPIKLLIKIDELVHEDTWVSFFIECRVVGTKLCGCCICLGAL
jgi:hypothetical protein